MPEYTGTICGDFSPPLRLDRYVAEHLGLLSRSQLKTRCISARVDGRAVKISRLLKGGERLELRWSESEPLHLAPEQAALHIIYEDEEVVVVNKDQGMVVHPGAGNRRGTLANALLYRRLFLRNRGGGGAEAEEADERLGIVHRLDKDTSGVLIAAYTVEAHGFLAAQFKNRQALKIYKAIVHGTPAERAGAVETRIARDPRNRKRFAVSAEKGKRALTGYTVLRSWGAYSLLELSPRTGRTHQLRVHMRHLGHPIVGDPLYGPGGGARGYTLMLHAESLRIRLPAREEASLFSAPLPERFAEAVSCFDKKEFI
jgi:23S rRNA pseudouridine1911/1915/1917 synthase